MACDVPTPEPGAVVSRSGLFCEFCDSLWQILNGRKRTQKTQKYGTDLDKNLDTIRQVIVITVHLPKPRTFINQTTGQ